MVKKILILGLNPISLRLKDVFSDVVIFTDKNQFGRFFKSDQGCIEVLESKDQVLKKVQKENFQFDLVISIGCPWILDGLTLNGLNNTILNLHGTHLPHYRGGTTYSWYILNRKRTGMCALHKMTERIDEGDIVKWREYRIPIELRKPSQLMKLYEEENNKFLIEFIKKWRKGAYTSNYSISIQPEYLSTYWPRLMTKYHGAINWSWGGYDLESFICAFDDPYEGAYTQVNEKRVHLKDVYFEPDAHVYHPFQYGLIYRISDMGIYVSVSGGTLIINTVTGVNGASQLEKICVGDRFWTSAEDIKYHATKIIKTSKGLKPKFLP